MRIPFLSKLHRVLFIEYPENIGSMSPGRRISLNVLRISWVTFLDIFEGTYSRSAMSLAYKTLQSFVPLIALSFALFQAFGFHNQIEPFLTQYLLPFGEDGIEISRRIIEFVRNIRVGMLGAVGFAILLYSAVTTMLMIENTINSLWHLGPRRSFYYRFVLFGSLIIIGPVLLFAAFSITAAFTNATIIALLSQVKQFEFVIYLSGLMVPFVMIVTVLTVMYEAMPATNVSWRAALVGATIAGLLWELAQWAFTLFVVRSAKYEAIYSGFAVLIVFFIWLYVIWLIFLIGSNIVQYLQFPSALDIRVERSRTSLRFQEQLALAIMVLIADAYEHSGKGWSELSLSQYFKLPVSYVMKTIQTLISAGLLLPVYGKQLHLIPAHPADRITIASVLGSIRNAGEGRSLSIQDLPAPASVTLVSEKYHSMLENTFREMTLRDLTELDKGNAGENENGHDTE